VSAGIAHELNNPLAVLRGYAEVTGDLVRSARRGEAWDAALAEKYLDRIDAQVERMSTIIRHVRDFSRQNAFTRDRVRVNDVVRRSCTLLAEQLRLARIQVDLRLDPTDPAVLGEAGRLEQVVVNLLANARDAIQEAGGPSGGVVQVCTRALPDGEVEASVLDDGVGMPPEVLAEMFTPFFTTKGPGKGTGLGLSISHGIVDEHGGRLFAESHPGRGTRVVLRLPAAP
jgi:signal transduction histidine kinase